MNGKAPIHEPFTRFEEALASAKGIGTALIPEPTAFALATVGDDGQPAVRILRGSAALGG